MPQPLPDIINYNLKVIFIGFNPGQRSAELGHHYAGRSNRFWKFLFKSGLTPVLLRACEDRKLLDYGYGSVNIVDRPSRRAAELTKDEFERGREVLKDKLSKYRPKIACYLGIGVYKEFTKLKKVAQGLQNSHAVSGVLDFVISSPSGLNRIPIEEQLSYYLELKHIINRLN